MNTVILKCKSCGGTLSVDSNREILICPYCRSRELILDSDNVKKQRIKSKAYKDVEFEKQKTRKEIEIEREKTKREIELGKKEIEEKAAVKGTIIFISLLALMMLFSFVLLLLDGDDSSDNTKYISTPNSARHYRGDDYQAVVNELRDAGFRDVIATPLDDLKNFLQKGNDGKIERISIDGVTNFKKDTSFPERAKIRITYHSFPEDKG